jgi:hypothetical protein
VTVAERDELLDSIDLVEHELEAGKDVVGLTGPRHDALLVALADLVARAVRIWLVAVGDASGTPTPPDFPVGP